MNIEGMKRALVEYQALLEAWENVGIVTKKDGTPFKTLKRNFTDCVFFEKYGLERIGISIAKDRYYYHDDLIIYDKVKSVEGINNLVYDRIKTLEESVKEWRHAIDVIENKIVDIDSLAENIMDDLKEKCKGNSIVINQYRYELINKLKEMY